MPPTDRFVPRFAAEPPQDGLPDGAWAGVLAERFLDACAEVLRREGNSGSPSEISWYPDRSWNGVTYVPASTITDNGYELFGYVSFEPAAQPGEAPERLDALAEQTEETAERNPDWKLDISDEVIGSWRGPGGQEATMTLVWGRALLQGGDVATAELGGIVVDQCELEYDRFTLIAPDDYGADLLEIALFDSNGGELARESLYEEDDEEQ